MFSFIMQQQQIEFLNTPFLSSLDLLFPVGDDLRIHKMAAVKLIWRFLAPSWCIQFHRSIPTTVGTQLVFPNQLLFMFLRMH